MNRPEYTIKMIYGFFCHWIYLALPCSWCFAFNSKIGNALLPWAGFYAYRTSFKKYNEMITLRGKEYYE